MHNATRPILVAALCGVFVACTADPTGPRSLPPTHRPAFAVSLDAPATPTPVSAQVTGQLDALRATVQVTWIDNVTAPDEWVTCGWFTAADGAPATTQCAYASDYDHPVGSTGDRTATLIVPLTGVDHVRFTTSRWVTIEVAPGVTSRTAVHSAMSDAIPVAPLVTVTTTRGKKR